MVKKLNADSAAKQVTEALQPVVTGNMAAGVRQTPMPANTPPSSPEVRRALGIVKPLWNES